jgi:Spy/CpxP family protein refolding chaperone
MRLYALAALVIAIPVIALAQPPGLSDGDPSARIDHHIERLTAHLSLDDSQAAEVRAVMEATHQEMAAAHEEIKAAIDALRSARQDGDSRELKKALQAAENARDDVRDLHDASRDKINAILTLEQRAMLFEIEIKKHHRERELRQRIRDHHGDRDGDRRDRLESRERIDL